MIFVTVYTFITQLFGFLATHKENYKWLLIYLALLLILVGLDIWIATEKFYVILILVIVGIIFAAYVYKFARNIKMANLPVHETVLRVVHQGHLNGNQTLASGEIISQRTLSN